MKGDVVVFNLKFIISFGLDALSIFISVFGSVYFAKIALAKKLSAVLDSEPKHNYFLESARIIFGYSIIASFCNFIIVILLLQDFSWFQLVNLLIENLRICVLVGGNVALINLLVTIKNQ